MISGQQRIVCWVVLVWKNPDSEIMFLTFSLCVYSEFTAFFCLWSFGFYKGMSLTPDAERALEEAFLGDAALGPVSCEDYFAPPSRTTALDEVERFLQASDGEALEASSARFALSAKASTKSGAYASPLVRRTAAAAAAASSPRTSSSDSPFHERIVEARSRYQELARERTTPKQQGWTSTSSATTTSKSSVRQAEPRRSYTFQPTTRSLRLHAPPSAEGEKGVRPLCVEELPDAPVVTLESCEGEHPEGEEGEGSGGRGASESEGAAKDGPVESCPSGIDNDRGTPGPAEDGKGVQRKIVKGVRRAKAPSAIPREKFSKLRIECASLLSTLCNDMMT